MKTRPKSIKKPMGTFSQPVDQTSCRPQRLPTVFGLTGAQSLAFSKPCAFRAARGARFSKKRKRERDGMDGDSGAQRCLEIGPPSNGWFIFDLFRGPGRTWQAPVKLEACPKQAEMGTQNASDRISGAN